ncbi:MAG: ATP-binding protein [Holophaga sp.]|nr:ATP-binding protein [Holophaga sp.]
MTDSPEHADAPSAATALRLQAEAAIRLKLTQPGQCLEAISPEAALEILHELQVHQIELEMQNEELRKRQEELDLALERYFNLYEFAPVGYCTLSEQGLILKANLTVSELLGAVRSSFIHQRISTFIHPKDQDIYYRHRLQLFETDEPQSFELRMLKRDGTHFWAHMATSIAQGSADATECRVVLSDITVRKQAEEKARHLEDLLQQAQKMESLGVLAGGVAHDMNNVLGAILGLASANIEALSAGSPPHKAFETIIRAAERGGKTVKSLLNFARLTPAEEHVLDMNAILQEEAKLLERTTLAKVRLEMDLAKDLQVMLGDASALSHAVMNLCVNAVDAMPPNGTLTLRTRNIDPDWIEVEVEDTGPGMSKEVLERAMEPFFTTKETGKGTGLGLSIVYGTVKAHRGLMAIHSELGQGTRVQLQFPTCAPAMPKEPSQQSAQKDEHKILTVLVVDDDELIRVTMAPLLETLGHRAICVESGEAALEQLAGGLEPDIVMLDMNMPGLGGAGTLPRLRVLRPFTPVLLATGRMDQFATDLAEAYPSVTLLAKPFSVAELRNSLQLLG